MPTAIARLATAVLTTSLIAGCVADGGRYRPYGRPSSQRVRPQTITCASDDGGARTCRTSMRIARAEIEKRLSKSPCDRGRTWGYDGNEVWVDQGCRAHFRIYPAGSYDGGNDGASIVRCESVDNRHRRCATGARIEHAEVERRLSDARCERGESWGIDGRAIWVDRGCRADFRVHRR